LPVLLCCTEKIVYRWRDFTPRPNSTSHKIKNDIQAIGRQHLRWLSNVHALSATLAHGTSRGFAQVEGSPDRMIQTDANTTKTHKPQVKSR
jgi:hypothetical protein